MHPVAALAEVAGRQPARCLPAWHVGVSVGIAGCCAWSRRHRLFLPAIRGRGLALELGIDAHFRAICSYELTLELGAGARSRAVCARGHIHCVSADARLSAGAFPDTVGSLDRDEGSSHAQVLAPPFLWAGLIRDSYVEVALKDP